MTEEFTNELSHPGMPSGLSSESAPPASAAAETTLGAEPEPVRAPWSLASAFPDPQSSEPSFPNPSFLELPGMNAATPPATAGRETAPLRIAVSALSDIGCVRTNNEDAFGYDESLGIFVICDGMGGMASGEIASSRAVAAIVNSFAGTAILDVPVSTRLLLAITAANSDVWENGQLPANRGMGTTAVVAALDGDKLILGNVGDSRAYILQDRQCVQLTVDHSYLNELIRNGTLTIENARSADLGGMESVITRAVGVSAEVQPDFFSVDLKPGTAVLLATDGLTRYLLPDEIAAVFSASPFESVCANLIEVAKQRGGQDNVTCLLLVALSA
jgi:protein phosphatase